MSHLRGGIEVTEVEAKRKAHALGIPLIVATDIALYLTMTLSDIAEEWAECPIEMLKVLSAAFPLKGTPLVGEVLDGFD